MDWLITGLGAVWGWTVTAYLVWRALPGIKADLRSLRRRFRLGGTGGKYGARRSSGGVL